MTSLAKREEHQWPNQLEEIASPRHGEEHTKRTQRNPARDTYGVIFNEKTKSNKF